MDPRKKYEADIQRGDISFDDEQSSIIDYTEKLYYALISDLQKSKTFINKYILRNGTSIQGIYLWGGVGRGKTYLIDSLYDCLPFEQKKRSHFHSFMLDIHSELKTLSKTPNPLGILARRLSESTCVLFLDEFHVHDIADAMLLHGLFDELIKNNVTLVFTSNIPIDKLYKDGIQYNNFIPAIQLIKNNTTELCLNGIKDYRKEIIAENEIYYRLPEQLATEKLNKYINELSPTSVTYYSHIIIHERKINVIAVTDGVIWFEYNELFRTPRSSADYLEIARMYHTVLVSNVSVMKEEDDNPAKRFIHFIDTLYDHNVKLILNAEEEADRLYTGKRLAFAFQRTISRLSEMGTEKYLLLPHAAN